MSKKIQLKSEICLNGHIIKSNLKQEDSQTCNFCSSCGGKVYISCESCGSPIPGDLLEEESGFTLNFSALNNPFCTNPEEYSTPSTNYKELEKINITPNFCTHCGTMYPWTKNFIKNYNLLLESYSEEIDSNLKNIISNATENLLKENFNKNSIYLPILKSSLNMVSIITKDTLINTIVSYIGESAKVLFSTGSSS